MNKDELISVCFLLINECIKTNATSMSIGQENVTKLGEKLGDWKITVEKIEK